jgi:hypothetical protein
MIPDRVIEFIQGPVFMQLGTRDAALRPAHAFIVGARVHDDRQTVTVLVPTARADRTLRNLADNGRVACACGHVSHESYQLKGTYLSSRPADAEDQARQETFRAALLASALEAGYPEAVARPLTQGFAYAPAVAITFRAEEVYQQTPGPDAGNRLA